jgi:hypothetical protein
VFGFDENTFSIGSIIEFDSSVPSFDTSTAPNSDYARAGAFVVAIGTDIYVVGGVNDDLVPLATNERYDTIQKQFHQHADLPVALAHGAAVNFQDHLVLLGGEDGNGDALSAVQKYEFAPIDAWGGYAALPVVKSHFCAAASAHRMYVAGGNDASVHFYEVIPDQWFPLPDLPTPRKDLACVLLRNSFFAMGGVDLSSGEATDVVEILDVLQGSWSTAQPLPQPRYSFAALPLNGNILIAFGGPTLTSVIEFDYDSAAWNDVVIPMPVSRSDFTAVKLLV